MGAVRGNGGRRALAQSRRLAEIQRGCRRIIAISDKTLADERRGVGASLKVYYVSIATRLFNIIAPSKGYDLRVGKPQVSQLLGASSAATGVLRVWLREPTALRQRVGGIRL